MVIAELRSVNQVREKEKKELEMMVFNKLLLSKPPMSSHTPSSGAYMVVYKNAKLFHTPENTSIAPISDFYIQGMEVVDSEEDIVLEFGGTEGWRDNDTHQVEHYLIISRSVELIEMPQAMTII